MCARQKVLLKGTVHVAITPKVFDVLYLLVSRSGEVVSRDALRTVVWGDRIVEEAVISRTISLLRTALRPHLDGQGPIQTISKRGYRFVMPVERR